MKALRPYRCDVCHQKFWRREAANDHVAWTHNVSPAYAAMYITIRRRGRFHR